MSDGTWRRVRPSRKARKLIVTNVTIVISCDTVCLRMTASECHRARQPWR